MIPAILMPQEASGPLVEVGRYYEYTCNCPDFTKSTGAAPHSPWSSAKSARDWSDSRAGLSQGEYCWHIWAVIQEEGDGAPVPTDIPPDPSPKISPKKPGPDGTKAWSADWAKWP